MSKSRGNVVTPDRYVDAHGSDVLRCALLFSAPWEQGGEFSGDAIAGVERFFARLWRVVTGPDGEPPAAGVVDRAVAGVGEAIERLTFNVAIARLMELTPHARTAEAKRVLVRLLAPLAPHLAEELWHRLGEPYSVHEQAWPTYDEDALASDRVTLVVQVDGTVRGRVEVAAGLREPAAVAAAESAVAEALRGRTVVRAIHVPDRLVNLVIG
jgi:leucyl-tRNA synthetase